MLSYLLNSGLIEPSKTWYEFNSLSFPNEFKKWQFLTACKAHKAKRSWRSSSGAEQSDALYYLETSF